MLSSRLYSIAVLLSARGVGLALQFLMQIAVGRLTGAYGVGLLQLCATWLSGLGELTAIGLPTHAMKTVAGSETQFTREQVGAYLRQCVKLMLLAWLALSSIGFVLIYAMTRANWHSDASINTLTDPQFVVLASLGAAIAYALMRFFADALKSLGKRNIAVFVENAGAPVIVLIACLASALTDQTISPRMVVTLFCAGFAAAALALFIYLIHTLKKSRAYTQTVLNDSPRPSKEAVSFWGTSILSIGIINYPFILLPFFADLPTIGVFAVAFKLTNTITSIIVMLAAVFGPQFAALHVARDNAGLWKTLLKSQSASLAIYLPLIAVLILFIDPITRLFGTEFSGASQFVVILAIGQLVNAATGLPGVMLNMTGHGRPEFFINMIVLVMAVISSIVAGSLFGAMGVAVVYALAISAKNAASYYAALVCIDKVPLFARPTRWVKSVDADVSRPSQA